ncbi:MAG: hypothetical protein K2J72_07700, partial [Oscillospiraceae bacterium]|nr:hypothetical protein [Oscillospiraceae bacterium]
TTEVTNLTFLSITARLSIERVFIAFGHMHASLLINAGVDVATVSADLGHTNSSPVSGTIIISANPVKWAFAEMIFCFQPHLVIEWSLF